MAYENLNLPDNAIPEGSDISHIEEGVAELYNSLAELLTVTTYTFDEITLSGQLSNSGVISLTVTPPTGYKNIGVVGTNTNNGNIICGRSYLYDSTTVRAAFVSVSSSSITVSPVAYVLQIKS